MAVPGAGEAVTGFMDAMKNQPLALALVVMNFALIGFTYYQSSEFNAQRADNIKLFIQMQTEVQKLLSQCVIPPPQQRGELMITLPPTRPAVEERDQ